ncbi:MAG TPA: AI-2E family transporter [Gemmatimonadales bacterium]|nr:AI-2E family transporter [Gemmatimonadales bacterium]
MSTPARRAPTVTLSWRSVPALAAALALGLGALAAFRFLIRPLALLTIAITIGEALIPLVERLARRVPRALAIGIVFFGVFLAAGLLGWIVVPRLVAQGQAFAERVPELVARARAWLERLPWFSGDQLAQYLGPRLAQAGGLLVSLPLQLFSLAADVLVVVFLAIYWVAGVPALRRFVYSLFPLEHRIGAAQVFGDMARAMGGYVRGAAINAVIMGALAWLGLSLIGVDYAIVLGVLTMLGEPIPFLGPLLAAIPVVLIALLQSPAKALLALGLYVILQNVEGHLLTPNIMRRETEVPQTLVIFALLAGGAVGGLLGVLVALPLAGAVRVFLLRVIAPAIRRRVGAPPPDGVTPAT